MNLDKIWQTALGELEITLSHANYATWFKNTFILSYEDKIITLGVPSVFFREWLRNKYHDEIFRVLKKILPDLSTIEYKVTTIKKKAPETLTAEPETEPVREKVYLKDGKGEKASLNPRYTFNAFVVGNSNRLAHAASIAVSKKIGRAYNPLFLYGGVGLGKTHLMQAIGNAILDRLPKKRVLYVSCEKFTDDFIWALKANKPDVFKDTYRKVDTLLVDDIQFLAGREGTQDAFFHTFNTLHDKNKQIVITSDRHPKEIQRIANRLKSRFEWGMIADIQSPDFEMRKAILRSKASEKKVELPDDVMDYIAENIRQNIRELEGALNRLLAQIEIRRLDLNVENTIQALAGLISSRARSVSSDKIFEIVGKFYNIAKEDLLGKKRNKEIVTPRQIAMHLLRAELNLSYPQIAYKIGKKDHTTIIHGCSKIEKEIRNNENFQKEIAALKEKLYL